MENIAVRDVENKKPQDPSAEAKMLVGLYGTDNPLRMLTIYLKASRYYV